MDGPFVVIGGDAAGLSAASKYARETEDRDVIVFERGAWVSYAHCGMPYYVKGEIESLTALTSLTPAEIEDRGIDLRRHHEVVDIDPAARTVTVRGPDGTDTQEYGSLLIATGAKATESPLSGTDLEGVFTMHSMDAAAALRTYLREPADVDPGAVDGEFVDREVVSRYADLAPPETAGIVGGGYVGVEMAEALAAYDIPVHLFQRSEHLLPAFGEAVGSAVEAHLIDNDVDLHLETSVEAIQGESSVEAITFDEGRLETDLAIVGIGIKPNAELAEDAGIERHESGAIAADRYGRTSARSVYAAGDCAAVPHAVTGRPAWMPLGLTANRAGRAIGRTVSGTPTPVGAIAGTAVVKAFEMEAGRVGLLDDDRARRAGFEPIRETITAGSRSGYYPGAAETTVTLVADAGTGRVIGGSIVGRDRAAIRIDTLATAITAGLGVAELERLDLAYAPPFSPVWDPILVAAKVLGGRLDPR